MWGKKRDNGDDYRYKDGDARYATFDELRNTGVIEGGNNGICFGHDHTGQHELRGSHDYSALVLAGSRCGKSASLFANLLIGDHIGRGGLECSGGAIYDARGEHWDVTVLAATLNNYNCYRFAPLRGGWHGFNPWSSMRPDDPLLSIKNNSTFLDLIPIREKDEWPRSDARSWGAALNATIVYVHGRTSPKAFYEVLCAIDGDTDLWRNVRDCMLASEHPHIRSIAGNMTARQINARDTWTSPLSELHKAFQFMQSPWIADALDGDDFTIEGLCGPYSKDLLYVELPVMNPEISVPLSRFIFGSLIQERVRIGGEHKFVLYLDEASQLTGLASLEKAFSYVAGDGLITIAAYQEYAQMVDNFSESKAKAIVGSAPIRIFKSVRHPETAELVSTMAGTTTHEYARPLDHAIAKHKRSKAWRDILKGEQVQDSASELALQKAALEHRETMPRPLLRTDQVMKLPPSQMIAFYADMPGAISGTWINHYKIPEYAGLYLPNPRHNPNRVIITSKSGKETKVEAVREAVPDKLSHLPQYKHKEWVYIKGMRPKIS